MTFDYPESNPFCESTGSALNQLEWLTRYIEEECSGSISARFFYASSGDKLQFARKSITATVTDPPYYDAIAYADCSDFFYVWMKRTLGDVFPENFATPQTPKAEECTALKHHHHGSDDEAKAHFEHKLTQIFDAIEAQTSDMVAVMFAHQSTQAWTTLLNSILGARMNITGSWPMDTEMQGAIKTDKAYLESSVTVACRPVERAGTGSYQKVKRAIEAKVKDEVEKLYALGFRGADLLTACFGQAAGEFGNYEGVEKNDGTEVTVAELLELARQLASEALFAGIAGDDLTKFYLTMLELHGYAEFDLDEARKIVQSSLHLELSQIRQEGVLVQGKTGNTFRLARASEHLRGDKVNGTRHADALIAKAHRAILIYEGESHKKLVDFVGKLASKPKAPLWELCNKYAELLRQKEQGSPELKSLEGFVNSAKTLTSEAAAAGEAQQNLFSTGTP